jgi:hypothetical protein
VNYPLCSVTIEVRDSNSHADGTKFSRERRTNAIPSASDYCDVAGEVLHGRILTCISLGMQATVYPLATC